jgi:hypothetical protein
MYKKSAINFCGLFLLFTIIAGLTRNPPPTNVRCDNYIQIQFFLMNLHSCLVLHQKHEIAGLPRRQAGQAPNDGC